MWHSTVLWTNVSEENGMPQGQFWIVNSDDALKKFQQHIEEVYKKDRYLTVTWESGKKRSLKQNSALHVWCSALADTLNEKGLDMRKVIKADVDIPWNKQSVKDYIFKPVLEAMTGAESSADAEKVDYIKVYETLNKHLSQKFGVHVPWPVKKNE